MARFEAHITVDRQHAKVVRELGEAEGWVYSQITGCPLLGQGTYCYLTSYNPDALKLLGEMDSIVAKLALTTPAPIIVLRAKIERIIYDTKTGVDELFEDHRHDPVRGCTCVLCSEARRPLSEMGQ